MSTTGPVTRATRPTPPSCTAGVDAAGFVPLVDFVAAGFLAAGFFAAGFFAAGFLSVVALAMFGPLLGVRYFTSASAPPTISEICWVISAWRALFASRV